MSSSQLSRELPSCWRTGCNAGCRHHWVRVGSTIGLTTLYSTGSGEERTPALYVLTDHCSWSVYLDMHVLSAVVMIRLCYGRSHELMWSWGYGQCCPEQQRWWHQWMLVGDILNRQCKILHTQHWQHQLKKARLYHMKYTSTNYFGNIWVHVSVSAWTFMAIYIGSGVSLFRLGHIQYTDYNKPN